MLCNFLATEPERQLKLTLVWDRADLAENKILSNNGSVWTVRYFFILNMLQYFSDYIQTDRDDLTA